RCAGWGGPRSPGPAPVRASRAAARIAATPADDIAWFRVLRLHEGIGAVSARRVLDTLRPADPGPFDRWPDAAAAAPRRARDDLTATVTSLAKAAAQEHTPQRATAILAAPDRARPAAPARGGAPPRARAAPPPPRGRAPAAPGGGPPRPPPPSGGPPPPRVSASDLAGSPRLDEDFLVISTVHSAKGLEWPIVH